MNFGNLQDLEEEEDFEQQLAGSKASDPWPY
jgi:hypothetical protein